MEAFVGRLKSIREHFGVSARKLSLDLGLNQSAWAGYESGVAMPGAATLTALIQRDIDINWLLTGQGRMLRSAGATDISSAVSHIENEQVAQLGLGRMTIYARRSNLNLRYRLLDKLTTNFPTGLTLAQLETQLSATQEDVIAVLLELVDENVVGVQGGHPERYHAKSLSVVTPAVGPADQSQLGMAAIQFVVSEVLPNLEENATAVMIDSTAHVDDGKAFTREVIGFMRAAMQRRHSNTGDVVRLILAANVSGCSAVNAE